jgi:tetratricopeptide (TPR) repeat protein
MFHYHMSERNWDKAAQYAEKLGQKNSDQAKGLVYKFRLAMARNDIPAATSIATDLTTQFREFSRSWLYLGQAHQAANNYDAAIGAYNLALEKQSDNSEALAGNIQCYFQKGKPEEALRFINRGRAAHPSSPYFKNQWTAYQLSQYGDPSQVVQPALEERDANPKDPNRWIALGRAQYSAGQKRDNPKSAKFISDAKATFTEALKRWPNQTVIWAFLSEISDFENDAAGGEALLKKMVASPDFQNAPEAAMMLADHYLRHNAPEKGEATMKEALEHFKNYKDPRPASEVRRRLAAYYTQNKRWDDALKLLDPASPDQMVRQQIVEIYMLQAAATKNDPALFGKAEKLVRSMLATTPEDAQLHALLGVVLLNMNQAQRAEESLNTALKLDPKNQAALYSRAQLRMKEQPPQLDAAIADLTTLREVNPKHLEGRVTLADALRQQHHYEDAARELESALVMAPYRRDIRVNLAGLYASVRPANWNDAERVLADAERIEPKEVLWKRMLAKLWSARAIQEKAPALHEKATAKIREALQMAPTVVLRDYLDILESAKNWQQLKAETEQVFKTVPNAEKTGWEFYIKHAIAQSNLGEPRKSMEDFEKAMQIAEADKTLSQDVLVQIIDRMEQTRGADETIARVKTLLTRANGAAATRWKVVLARLYFIKKEYPTAIDYIEQARKESANLDVNQQVGALSVAGNIYMMSGDYPMARTAFEQLLAKRADDLATLNNLAFLVAEHTQPPDMAKAMEYSKRAYDVMTKNNMVDPNVLDTVGWINVLSGGAKLDEGIRLLNESIAAGEIPEAQYHYGEALMKKNLPEYARTSLLRASELVSAKTPVDEVLKKKVDDALARVDKVLGPAPVKQ